MKKYLFILLMCLSMTNIFAQYTTGSPPMIDWRREQLWPQKPLIYNTPPGAVSIPDSLSGEDWFYSVQVRYDSLNVPQGYLCSGYIGVPKINDAYTIAINTTYGSCGSGYVNDDCDDLRFIDTSGLGPSYHPIEAGTLMPALTFLDLNGNYPTSSSVDYVVFPGLGNFFHALPTSDGGYLAVGRSYFSSKLNFVSGVLSSISPLAYNANSLQTFEKSTNGGSCAPWGYAKGLVVKYDKNRNVVWNYTYGTATYTAGPTNPAFAEAGIVEHAIECSGGYIIAGLSTAGGAWYKKISSNGSIIWSNNITSLTTVNAIVKTIENGQEVYYMGGDDYNGGNGGRGFVMKVNAAGTVKWTIYLDPSTHWDVITGIDLSNDGKVFVAGFHDYSGYNFGYGYVYKLDTAGATLNSYTESFQCQAGDLRYALTATSDGGCAVVSTVVQYPVGCNFQLPHNYPLGYTGHDTCHPYISRWNSDAYVAKFDASLNKTWSKAFDALTQTPGGTTVDILSGCSTCGGTCPLSSWQIPNQSGKDVSRQECLFAITEAPDRSLVIAGKTSYNLDDSYIVKFVCDTVNSARIYTSTTITGNQKYKTGAIETRTNYVAANTSRITMNACRYILFDQVTTLNSGSVVTASVGAYNCCNSIAGGMRMGSFSDEGSFLIPNDNNSTDKLGSIQVSVFPNPNNGTFTLLLESDQSQVVSVDIIDSFGRIVTSKKGLGVNGQSQTEISLNSFGKGIYAVKLYSGGNSLVKKVIVE